MVRLRLTNRCPNGYNGATGAWATGQEKEVEDAEAQRLLRHFPTWFEPVAPGEGAPTRPPAPELSPPAVAGRRTKPTPRGMRVK